MFDFDEEFAGVHKHREVPRASRVLIDGGTKLTETDVLVLAVVDGAFGRAVDDHLHEEGHGLAAFHSGEHLRVLGDKGAFELRHGALFANLGAFLVLEVDLLERCRVELADLGLEGALGRELVLGFHRSIDGLLHEFVGIEEVFVIHCVSFTASRSLRPLVPPVGLPELQWQGRWLPADWRPQRGACDVRAQRLSGRNREQSRCYSGERGS